MVLSNTPSTVTSWNFSFAGSLFHFDFFFSPHFLVPVSFGFDFIFWFFLSVVGVPIYLSMKTRWSLAVLQTSPLFFFSFLIELRTSFSHACPINILAP